MDAMKKHSADADAYTVEKLTSFINEHGMIDIAPGEIVGLLNRIEKRRVGLNEIVDRLPRTMDGVIFIPRLGQELWWVDAKTGPCYCCSCVHIGDEWVNEHANLPVSECYSTKQAAIEAREGVDCNG